MKLDLYLGLLLPICIIYFNKSSSYSRYTSIEFSSKRNELDLANPEKILTFTVMHPMKRLQFGSLIVSWNRDSN